MTSGDEPVIAGDAEGPSAVEPRPAASLIVLRANPGEAPSILMGRRAAGHRFMPNVLVFPGGAVDAADHHARPASVLRPDVQARLERSASPSLAQALAIAACRELREEVGVSLGEKPSLHRLDYLCRAITPPSRSMRFDARFFIVDTAHVAGTPAASSELEQPGWYTVAEALAQTLAAATEAILAQLQRWLAHQDKGGPVPVLRNRVWEQE